MPVRTVERRWSAMGSDAHVVVHGGDSGLVASAVRRVGELEGRWSRFLPESEVCRLNRRAGTPVEVSADTALLVGLARYARRMTGGAFDPTVLSDLEDWGYDRDLRAVVDAPHTAPPNDRRPTADGTIRVDATAGTVTLGVGVGFDPGGIGKGLAADLVTRGLLVGGAVGVCVNLGGDLRVGGRPPSGGAWSVGLPADQHDRGVVVRVASGGLATSTPQRRRWRVGTAWAHHLVDPATGRPSRNATTSTTVVASSAWRAEVLATAASVVPGDDVAALVARGRGRIVSRSMPTPATPATSADAAA